MKSPETRRGTERLALGQLLPPGLGSEVTREWSFVPPFERFYLNEKLAPEAERRLNRALADSDSRSNWCLKCHRGFACIVDLTINGVPIRELSKSAGKDVKS